MSKELKTTNNQQAAVIDPMSLISLAVQQNADTDKLEKLMALQERWEANEARKAYNHAMSNFRDESIEIIKTKQVSYKETKYKHATLDQIVETVAPYLSKHGLRAHWESSQADGLIKVKCIVTHSLGHSEYSELASSPDQSGGKNSIQAIGSAQTYLQRYTFLAITGLAAKDQDDDALKTAYKQSQKDYFDDCVENGDSLGIYIISKTSEVEVYAGLFNSFPAGQKTKMKAKVRELESEGLETFTSAIGCLHENDQTGLEELIQDCSAITLKMFKRCLNAQELAAFEEMTNA